MICCRPMRTNTARARLVVSWCVALGTAAALTTLGVWVRAQPGELSAGGPPAPAASAPPGASGSRLAPDRAAVPELAALEAALARLRRGAQADVDAGGPALEHAALALARARTAERDHPGAPSRRQVEATPAASAPDGAGQSTPATRAASLPARRIAYAALLLAEAQRDREHARLARDEAARERAQADGALGLATRALAMARENAATAGVPPNAPAGPEATGAAPNADTGEDSGTDEASPGDEGAETP